MNRLALLLVFLCCCTFSLSHGTDIKEIEWDSLVPELPAQKNPLAGMSEEEVGFVEWIIYLRESLPAKVTEHNKGLFDEMNTAIPELKKKGIDVDKIIADRRDRSSAVNKDLDGVDVRLAGYLLPLDLSGKAVKEFLLVPYVGACIHVPPPPPNQLVYAVSTTAVPYEIEKLFLPVSVTGKMAVKSLSKDLFLVDGSDNVDIGYSMTVSKIEEYKHKQ